MSNEEKKEIIKKGENKECSEGPIIDEKVTAHIMQIFGNQAQQYVPTQGQVDKILELQEKGMDYTHEERKNFSPKQKIELIIFIAVIVVVFFIFVLALFFAKEYLGEIISGAVGFIAGGAGGYGFASKSKKSNDDNE